MKKNKLIKLLQSIKGNPEVMFYNAFVEDMVHIMPPTIDEQVRLKTEWLKKFLHNEGKPYEGPEEWRYSGSKLENLNPELYQRRKIIILEARFAGKSTFDRMGSISY